MRTLRRRIRDLAARQRGAVARWQLAEHGLSKNEIDAGLRGWRRVYQGVCAMEDLDELGWYMAAALAGGPGAALSHGTALLLLGLRDQAPQEVHVSVPRAGGQQREGLVIHRRKLVDRWNAFGIPVTSPTQSLKDANLPPHELYHSLDRAEKLAYRLTLPRSVISQLQQRVNGSTRSAAEARFLLLCADHGIDLPLVNHQLNGVETDFHWPQLKLALEVDGWEFHNERPQFEEDRRRELLHAAAGYTVIRASANHVRDAPDLVAAAVRRACVDRREHDRRTSPAEARRAQRHR